MALVFRRLGGALPFRFVGGLPSFPLLAMLATGSGGELRGRSATWMLCWLFFSGFFALCLYSVWFSTVEYMQVFLKKMFCDKIQTVYLIATNNACWPKVTSSKFSGSAALVGWAGSPRLVLIFCSFLFSFINFDI